MGPVAVFRRVLRARIVAAFLSPLFLTACLESKTPLFDVARGETPIQTGKYTKQEYLLGHWLDKEKGQITLSKSVYEWRKENITSTDDGNTKTSYDYVEHAFTLHGIGRGKFVAMKVCLNCETKYVYDLLEFLDGDILQSGVDCDGVRVIPNVILVSASDTVCSVDDVGKLTGIMLSFSERRYPRYRYIRTGEVAP